MKTVLTGVRYNMENFSAVSNGMEVELVHDTTNTHSQYAVRVIAKGFGVIGHMYENYIPVGVRQYEEELIDSKTFIKEVLAKNKTFRAQIIQKKPNTAVIGIVLDTNDSNSNIEGEEMIKWTENASGESITLVGCAHNSTVKNIGDKVHIHIINYEYVNENRIKGTSIALNEMNEKVGVLPQAEDKQAILRENNCNFVTNKRFKSDYASDVAITDEYVIIDISECGRYVKLGLSQSEDVVEAETEAEPVTTENEVTDEVISLVTMLQSTNRGLLEAEEVIEQTTVNEVSVEAETEAEMEIDEMKIDEVLANDVTLKQWVAERNELINKMSDLNEKLRKAEEELEYREKVISERVEAMTLIHQIKEKLSSMEIEELREIHNKFIDDGASSNEEDTTSSSNNEETNDNGVDNWETETFENALNEIKKYNSLEQLHRDCGNPNTIIGKIALDIENMNLEAVIKTGYVHKRHMDKLEDVQIAELNMAIHRQEKILKGIIEE